jgi:type IV conjugative transfer system coupling protein TraD
MARQSQHIADDVSRGVGLLHLRIRTQLQSVVRVCLITAIAVVSIPLLALWFGAEPHSIPAAIWWKIAATMTDQGWGTRPLHPIADPRAWQAQDIMRDPFFSERATAISDLLRRSLIYAAVSAPFIFAGVLMAVRRLGKSARESYFLRGRKKTTAKELADLLARRRVASDLAIGDIPLIAGKETQHTLLLGTIGSGKTQAILALLDRVRQRGDIAIVYDIAGSFIPTHYRPDVGDRILNPLDMRSAEWSPWAEITHPADADRLAASLIPSPDGQNQFFTDAARAIYSTALRIMQDARPRTILDLIRLLLIAPRQAKEARFAGTEIAKFYDPGAERTGINIDITAANYIRSLRFLQATAGGPTDFSVGDFVRTADRAIGNQSAKPWLFVSSRRKEHDAIKPLITSVLDSAIAAALSLPENLDRRIWIFLDELDSLYQLPSLASALQEGRKYGICVVAGIQDILQVLDVYGKERGEAMVGLFNTKGIFRVNSKHSAEYASFLLGEVEDEHTEESARYGATVGFESMNLGTRREVEKLVLPTDIMDLPDLRCWVKLPGPYPIATTDLPHPTKTNRPRNHPAFIEGDLSDTVAAHLRDGAATPGTTDPASGAGPSPDGATRTPVGTPDGSVRPTIQEPEQQLVFDPAQDALQLHPR